MTNLLNRARMTTATTGTGPVTLGSAVSGYFTFAEAGAVDATVYSYTLVDGADFEMGIGSYTSSGTTFSRDTVTASKIGGTAGTSKINLSGSAEIFITALAADLVTPTATQTLTNKTLTSPVLSAQTATLPALKFTQAVLQTTPAAGDIEADANGFLGCITAGNRGYFPVRNFIRADATRTFTSNTSEQAIFNSPANGRLTLAAATYLFEALIALTGMSATSGNAAFDFLGAGTAVVGDILYHVVGGDAASGGAGAAQGGSWAVTQQTAASAVTAATGTAAIFRIKGTFRVTTAGTIIPSMTLVTASAAVVSIGSYFLCERMGSTSIVSVGQWD